LQRSSREFERILQNLEVLGFATRRDFCFAGRTFEFLVSVNTAAGIDLSGTIENACRQLLSEISVMRVAENWLIWNNLATDFKRSRDRSQLFDSIGRTISPRFSLVLLEVNTRRKITRYEMQGFIERVQRFIGFYRAQARKRRARKQKSRMARREYISFPVFAFFIAKDFDDQAWEAGKGKVKTIRLDCIPACRVFRKPDGLLITREITTRVLEYRIKKLERIEDIKYNTVLKGRLFEMIVDETFRKVGYKTAVRKEYFLDKGQITENETKVVFSDVDIQAIKEDGFNETILIECRNWDREIELTKVIESVRKLNVIGQYLKDKHEAQIKIMFVGPCREEEKIKVNEKSKFEVEILTKKQFRDKFCHYNKGLLTADFLFE
jgi:hypothetical protein